MSENKIDPEVKKALWKIILYAVTILGSLFAGNTMAKNGITFISKEVPHVEQRY